MKRLIGFLVRLYPRDWRDRYGEEMSALVEDSSPRTSAAFDVLKGAVVMRTQNWPFVKLAAVLSLVGALVGVGISLAQPNVYRSMAVLKINAVSPIDSKFAVQRLQMNVTSRGSLAAIITDPHLLLYGSDGQKWPGETTLDEMRASIRIVMSTADQPSLFRVQFSYSDPYKARATVEALTAKFIIAAHSTPYEVAVLDAASPAMENNASRRSRFAITGLMAGFALSVLIAWIRAAFRPAPIRTSVIWPFPKLALALSFGGGFVALVGAYFIPNEFRAVAVMQVQSNSGADTYSLVKDAEQQILSRESLTRIMLDPYLDLYESERTNMPLEQVIDVMRAHTRISLAPSRAGSTVFSIAFSYSEGLRARQKAHDTVQTIVTRFIDASTMQRRNDLAAGKPVDPRYATSYLEVLDPPTVPQRPVSPKRPIIALAGFIGGIILAAIISIGQKLTGPGAPSAEAELPLTS